MRDRRWLRGAITLGVLSALAGAMISSPVGAVFSPTKKKIKQIAGKVVSSRLAQVAPASAVASSNPTDFDLTLSTQEVLSATITLTGTRRIMAAASLTLYADTSGDLIFCRMQIDGTDAGQTANAVTPDVNGYDIQMPVLGSRTADAGPHTVRVMCNEDGDDNVFDRGDLLVWAA